MSSSPRGAAPGFVHLDVLSSYSLYASPSAPEEYARVAANQLETRERFRVVSEAVEERDEPVRSLALADYGLWSAVKMARACREHGLEHIAGLRVRVVAERSFSPWGEAAGELILLAVDDKGWLNLVALNNLGYLAGWGGGGPRIDWRDLAAHAEGLICLTGAAGSGLLPLYFDQSGADGDSAGALNVARRLAGIFPGRLYVELAFHRRPAERLLNRGLLVLAERLDLPVVAANAVRFATPAQALAHAILGAIGKGRRLSKNKPATYYSGRGGTRLPPIALEMLETQAYLKSAREMWHLFSQLPQAVEATREIARRCEFRLPLAEDTPVPFSYGPRRFHVPVAAQESTPGDPGVALGEVAAHGLRDRYAREGRGPVLGAAVARLEQELSLIRNCPHLPDLLLVAKRLADFCAERTIPLSARGSATASLVVWALGLADVCPLDHGLDSATFVYPGRPDMPDVDLEVASQYAPTVAAFIAGELAGHSQLAREGARSELPVRAALRVGVSVAFGARNAVRQVGTALRLHPARVNSLAQLVPLTAAPGAIESAVAHAPETGVPDLALSAEPQQTVLAVAAQIEAVPQRYGAHPSATTFDFEITSGDGNSGVLGWLPAQWVVPRNQQRGLVASPTQEGDYRSGGDDDPAPAAGEDQAAGGETGGGDGEQLGEESEALAGAVPRGLGALAVLVCQWDKDDLEALGLGKLDVTPSTTLATLASPAPEMPADETDATGRGAVSLSSRRLIEAGETLCLGQVESLGFRMLLKRARESFGQRARGGCLLRNLEDLAQLLAFWRPGAYDPEREEAYFGARYDGVRPRYAHPAFAGVLDQTGGELLYAEQLTELIELLGFEHDWAERLRSTITGHRLSERVEMERELRVEARSSGWTEEQVDALIDLLVRHAGYLFKHGHALALAQRTYEQARRKAEPATRARFFADVMNCGGSLQYGLGSAAEEARRVGLVLLGPCVNRSGERFGVEPHASSAGGHTVRVPLSVIKGLSRQAARHVVAVREAFGPYEGLLDFYQKTDRRLVKRGDVLLLVKLGAFGFTGLNRAQLTLAEQYYSATADLLRAGERNPSAVTPLAFDPASGRLPTYLEVPEWPPEALAAYELAHLGFYVGAPLELAQYDQRLAEESGAIRIAELAEFPDRAPVAVGGVLSSLRVRNTKRGEPMAWVSLADGTGSVEGIIFPSAYERIQRRQTPRQGAFAVATGRLAREEEGPPKIFVDDLQILGGRAAHLSALETAITRTLGDQTPG